MSAKRTVGQGGFSLPPNPSYIDFPRSDGDPSTWPTKTTREVDRDGAVNFMAHLDSEHPQNKKWRTSVGDAVSRKLKMPEGPNYVLRSFPDHYRLFDHHKGPANDPRHDLYLYGPKGRRFRSINEFIPHAIWLMGDINLDCECKYCGKRTQRDVTASMADILRTSLSQSPAPSRIIRSLPSKDKGKARANIPRVAEARKRDTKNYAAIQKSIKPLKASPSVLKQPMLVERANDTRAIYSKTAQSLRRWYREGEIVWCALPRPIKGVTQQGVTATLDYWPAVVDEVKFKSETFSIPTAPGSASLPAPQPVASSSAMQIDSAGADDGRGPMLPPSTEPVPWKTRQYARYKVHFLAVSHSMTIDDDDILPYQADMPSAELIQLMASHPPERFRFDRNTFTNFNPCPSGNPPSLFDAIPPFALAIQIASCISQAWCLTDEYELKYTISPNTSASAPPPRPSSSSFQSSSISASSSRMPSQSQAPVNSLQAAIEAASRHNDNLARSNHFYESASAVHPSMSSSSAQKTISKMVGMPPPPNQLSQIRYQGMWWGAERIWVDDFVRLKVPRRALAPTGDNHILPAAGPSKTEERNFHGPEQERPYLGAQMRGTFLRLDGIIVVDVEADGKPIKQARLTGRLYELVAADWEGDAPPPKDQEVNHSASAPQHPPTPVPAGAVERSNSGPPVDYILPAAPVGYKFREIVEPGFEFVGSLGLLGGRYYPGILQHHRMKARVSQALHSPDYQAHAGLWSLEGLAGGLYNSMDPSKYKKSRLVMMQDADREAATALADYVEKRMNERASQQQMTPVRGDDAMDIDGM